MVVIFVQLCWRRMALLSYGIESALIFEGEANHNALANGYLKFANLDSAELWFGRIEVSVVSYFPLLMVLKCGRVFLFPQELE
nr:hypothetical protein CFP56_74996 [Quercus suber]